MRRLREQPTAARHPPRRPALSHDRIALLPDGRVRLALKTPWADGTSHLLFTPEEFIGRLVALIPRPRANLVLYHGVLAPNARLRSKVVAYRRKHASPVASAVDVDTCEPSAPSAPPASAASTAPASRPTTTGSLWADLMRRAFGLDVLACPKCAGRLRLIACISQPSVIRKILRHLGLPADPPALRPARAPPPLDLFESA